ncbi:iron-siderophore ABC transporter substrate-binding protein [Propionibacterium australiense]|uniref:FhuD n=1 Tax=Propionibacterium australiense TaxID=119981 RepID=A0A383S3H7_9ACTN|nr:iron-siderophore ABC transporter substrate-binding protein [Propionibacterium australiense]RLP08880.1 iron-siderophore ABC transporter substrate-binding protein [Propionibacterium australiense]RLP11744.1 iron-siderophore ABC transporter substrate-binding protein [Propionibacterium australiense]SYZ32497.1 FhuD [Propionibacterium australiense]VEH90098.1 Probable siderophore-binding lipoprotein yfiY precursor [Propionibacterium australiense]
MKRFRVLAAAMALLTGVLTACSGTSSSDSQSSGQSSAGSFPATVQTYFGDVTVESAPQRIVALGWGDAETVLSLGYEPVGASDWLAFGGDGVGPWAAGQYTTSPTILGTTELSYEQVAALEPDLILDVKSAGDQDRYDRLSQIATTVGVPDADSLNYLTSTEKQLSTIAAALGVPEKGQQLQSELDQAISDAADSGWQGRTVSVAALTSTGWGAYVDGDTRLELLKQLGFTQNPDIAALPTASTGFSVDLSTEQLSALDADLIVAFPIYVETSRLTGDAAWQAIPAVQAGHAVVVDGDLSNAFSLGTVGSIQYALQNLTPRISEALAA